MKSFLVRSFFSPGARQFNEFTYEQIARDGAILIRRWQRGGVEFHSHYIHMYVCRPGGEWVSSTEMGLLARCGLAGQDQGWKLFFGERAKSQILLQQRREQNHSSTRLTSTTGTLLTQSKV